MNNASGSVKRHVEHILPKKQQPECQGSSPSGFGDVVLSQLIPARRKGVDGFSVETPGLLTDPVPISPSSDSLTDAWAPTVLKLCHNQAFCGLCDAQFLCLSTVQQQFHVW
ncbi:hypothetical protein AVEN_218633-1 [Araneus ventricosus]|uniref:Uncharacterized protein n=1 Tax=Araneus ventricosus TaxID=182803 RepID=A0A4Y2SGP6_ARAVE|nr:hypothetical protein AVEN_218633-1 [Araneus ventricosus]